MAGRFDRALLLASALEGSILRGTCDLRRLVRRCRRPAAGTCQYCGRAFCSDHGILVDDGQEICGRSRCQRKRIDLERHLRYKAVVRQQNADGRCWVPGCQTRPGGQCSRCRGFFCGRHLANRDLVGPRRAGLATVPCFHVRALLAPPPSLVTALACLDNQLCWCIIASVVDPAGWGFSPRPEKGVPTGRGGPAAVALTVFGGGTGRFPLVG
jgi:hypothetical protein